MTYESTLLTVILGASWIFDQLDGDVLCVSQRVPSTPLIFALGTPKVVDRE